MSEETHDASSLNQQRWSEENQIYCQNCQRYSTERLNFLEAGRNYTLRYEDYIYEQVKQLTIEQVSVKEKLSYERVSNIFRKISKKKLEIGGLLSV